MINFKLYEQSVKYPEYVNRALKKLQELLCQFVLNKNNGFEIFFQGSYENNTNILNHSDIDIVILYKKIFYRNIINFNFENNKNKVIFWSNNQNYFLQDFYLELLNFLKDDSTFLVTNGNKTIKCQIFKSNFTFDIVCAFEYRLYKNSIYYVTGNYIYDYENKKYIINFPKISKKNSDNKDIICNGNYKKFIRLIKNLMKNHINENDWISSFTLENIVYNVPNKYFCLNKINLRYKFIIKKSIYLIKKHWEKILESNEILFIKNIQNLTQEKCLIIFLKIKILIECNTN